MNHSLTGPPEIRVGVLLAVTTPADMDVDGHEDDGLNLDEDLDAGEPGHAEAWGRRGRHATTGGQRVVRLGHDVLRAAAEAVGHEVALVLDGVVAGMDQRHSAGGSIGPYTVDALELKFGVRATLGAGKAVEALLTATGEATVEVTVKLRQPDTSAGR